MKIQIKIFFIGLFLARLVSFAQQEKLALAYELYNGNKLDSARMLIDEVSNHPETSNDFQAWLIKAYVYKDLYKRNENSKEAGEIRNEAVKSFLKSRDLDVEKKELSNINQNLKFLASKYFNESRSKIDTIHHLEAQGLSEEFKKINLLVDPNLSFTARDLEFYLALSSVFQVCYDNNASKNCLDYAKVYLQKAIDTDPSSVSAIKNMGILYYNQGVNLIKKMEYDVSLEELSNYQDQSIKLFYQAEPFLLKAFEMSPTDVTVLEGLQGIYFQLSDFDKSNDFKLKLESITK